jgi:acetyl-CoA acetyltransferase
MDAAVIIDAVRSPLGRGKPGAGEVNQSGGALALGHPLGASGARLGLANATIVERVG